MDSTEEEAEKARKAEARKAYLENIREWYKEMWHEEAKKAEVRGDEMKMIEDSLVEYFTKVAKSGVSWGPLAIAMGLSSIDLAIIRRDAKTIDKQIKWVIMKWRHNMKKKGKSKNVDADSVITCLERNKAYGALRHLNETVLKELGKEWVDVNAEAPVEEISPPTPEVVPEVATLQEKSNKTTTVNDVDANSAPTPEEVASLDQISEKTTMAEEVVEIPKKEWQFIVESLKCLEARVKQLEQQREKKLPSMLDNH